MAVTETKEFRCSLHMPHAVNGISQQTYGEIMVYKGVKINPQWIDEDPRKL